MMQIRFLMDYSKIEQRCLGSPAYAELASIHTYLLCVQYVMTYVRHLSVYYAIMISFFRNLDCCECCLYSWEQVHHRRVDHDHCPRALRASRHARGQDRRGVRKQRVFLRCHFIVY